MTTPVESLKGSIRQTIASLRRDAPAARFIGEQVVNLVGRSFLRRLRPSPQSAPHTSSTSTAHTASSDHVNASAAQQPWPEYDMMTAREIIARLSDAPADVRSAVQEYERSNRARSTVLAATVSSPVKDQP